jgi:hypothetical protein
MAFVTGTAGSYADLLTAIQNACTAQGWTLDGSILSKGTAFFSLTASGSSIEMWGGLGAADGALTDTTFRPVYLAMFTTAASWPLAYDIHIHGDEVFVVVKYGVDYYSWLGFGCSPAPGVTATGTGNWFGASYGPLSVGGSISIMPTGNPTNARSSAGLGFLTGSSGAVDNQVCAQNFYAHHNLDGIGWSSSGSGVGTPDTAHSTWSNGPSRASVPSALSPLYSNQPNAWNSESCLLPITAYVARASSMVSPVVAIAHARLIRIDNYAPGDILTLGSDRWKIYPWLAKNSAARDGSTNSINHSGTMGWAVRYDGP